MADTTSTPTSEGRRFDFQTCLGRGGFGEVYLADMTSPGGLRSSVAVKLLLAGLDPRSQAVERLRDEARLLAVLRHAAILTVHDLVVLDNRVGLVAEYVEGADLKACIYDDADPIGPKALVQALELVADALDAAYNSTGPDGEPLHLIHRDIKPANIRLSTRGDVKVLDFGIAKAGMDGLEAKTHTDMIMGTVAYMSPERFQAGATMGPASDVFALGCILYEGLAGQSLFGDLTLHQAMAMSFARDKHEAWVRERVAELTQVTPAMRDMVLRMVAYDPEARPSAGDFVDWCEEVKASLPGPSLRRWSRGHAWPPPHTEDGELVGRSITEGTRPSWSAVGPMPEAEEPERSERGPSATPPVARVAHKTGVVQPQGPEASVEPAPRRVVASEDPETRWVRRETPPVPPPREPSPAPAPPRDDSEPAPVVAATASDPAPRPAGAPPPVPAVAGPAPPESAGLPRSTAAAPDETSPADKPRSAIPLLGLGAVGVVVAAGVLLLTVVGVGAAIAYQSTGTAAPSGAAGASVATTAGDRSASTEATEDTALPDGAVEEVAGDAAADLGSPRPAGVARSDAPPATAAASSGGGTSAPGATTEATIAASSSGCDPIDVMEGAAAAGSLKTSQLACADRRMRDASLKQTERDRYGRVALQQLEQTCSSGGSCVGYESSQRYFLEEVTQSDPTMTLHWAEYLLKKGVSSKAQADEVVKWTERAWDRRSTWKGATYVTKASRTLEVRAKASYQGYTATQAERDRREARDHAVEWTNFLLKLGRDVTEAKRLCISAAGSEEGCTNRLYDPSVTVTLSFISVPLGGDVLLDGKKVGTTPYNMEVTGGEHELEIRAGGRSDKRTITVGVGRPVRYVYKSADGSWVEGT